MQMFINGLITHRETHRAFFSRSSIDFWSCFSEYLNWLTFTLNTLWSNRWRKRQRRRRRSSWWIDKLFLLYLEQMTMEENKTKIMRGNVNQVWSIERSFLFYRRVKTQENYNKNIVGKKNRQIHSKNNDNDGIEKSKKELQIKVNLKWSVAQRSHTKKKEPNHQQSDWTGNCSGKKQRHHRQVTNQSSWFLCMINPVHDFLLSFFALDVRRFLFFFFIFRCLLLKVENIMYGQRRNQVTK